MAMFSVTYSTLRHARSKGLHVKYGCWGDSWRMLGSRLGDAWETLRKEVRSAWESLGRLLGNAWDSPQ